MNWIWVEGNFFACILYYFSVNHFSTRSPFDCTGVVKLGASVIVFCVLESSSISSGYLTVWAIG